MYKQEFGYEALTEIMKKYDLAKLKYVAGEAKPSYVITEEEIMIYLKKKTLYYHFKIS